MIKNIFKLFVLAILALTIVFYISYNRAVNKPYNEKGVVQTFTVEKGAGISQVGDSLRNKSIIMSDFFFKFFARDKNIQAGDYELSSSMTIPEIIEKLSIGETIKDERKIQIIEGWNNNDIANYFEKEGLFTREEFLSEVKNKDKYSGEFTFLKEIPEPYDMEGYLFPDTYSVFKNASLENIIIKMLTNLENKLSAKMLSDIKEQGKTLYEVMTMAALIEKEVRSRDDMKIVSGIFSNRLEVGQPLQSCATLAYVLGENKPRYTIEDTRIDSPYNTYRNQGLPPGPIANPGLQAIEAAIYPTDNDYNYFLSASETGETIFSRTLEEHNYNKSKYLK